MTDAIALGKMATAGTVATKLVADSSGMVSGMARATASLDRLTERMQRQAVVFGMTSEEARIYDRVQRGASGEAIQSAHAANEQIKALRAEAEARRQAAAITEAARTPLERYDQELQQLRRHLDAGRISEQTFGRAAEQVGQKLGVPTVQSQMLADQLRRQEAATRAAQAAQRDAAAVIEATRTPLEKYDRELTRYRELLRQGRITQETFSRAVRQSAQAHGVAAQGLSRLERVKHRVAAATARLTGGLRTMGGWVARIFTQVTALAAGGGLLWLMRSALTTGDATAKVAARLGLTTAALIGLHHAGQLAGVGSDTVNMALQRMTRRVAEAAQGSGEAVSAIRELGLSAQSLAQMTPDQQLATFADALQGVSTQGDRVRLAMKLFDSEGVALLNMLDGGSAALAAMRAEAERLGLTFSDADAEAIQNVNNEVTRLQGVIRGAAQRVAIEFAPALQAVTQAIVDAIPRLREIAAGVVAWLRQNGRLVIGLISAAAAVASFAFAWVQMRAVVSTSITIYKDVARAVVWLAAKIWAAAIGLKGMTLAAVANKIAMLASAIATKIATAAAIAFNVATGGLVLIVGAVVVALLAAVAALAAIGFAFFRARQQNISYGESCWRLIHAITGLKDETLQLLDAQRELDRSTAGVRRAQDKFKDAGTLDQQIKAQEELVTALERRLNAQRRVVEMAGQDVGIGTRGMRQQLEQATQALDKLRRKQQAAAMAGVNDDQQAKQWQDMVDRMQQQVATFGLSSRAAEIWKAQQTGATDEVIAKLRELDAELSRLENRQTLDRQFERLNEQLEDATFSPRLGKVMELEGLGATREQIAAVLDAMQQLEDLGSQDPIQRFSAAIEQLNTAFLRGRISFAAYQNELAHLRGELAAGLELEPEASPLETFNRQMAQLDQVREHLSDDQYLHGVERAQQKLREALDISLPPDPLKDYERSVDQLSRALAAGVINWEEYGQGVRAAREALESASRVESPGRPGLVRVGTAEQQRDAFERSTGLARIKDDIGERQLDVQQEMRNSLDRIERNTGERPEIDVVNF